MHDNWQMTQQMADLRVCGIVIAFAIIVMMVVMVQIVHMVMVIIARHKRCNRRFVVTINHLPSETRRHERAGEHDK